VLAGREGSTRGARDCEAPGPGHCRCEAGPGARATCSRVRWPTASPMVWRFSPVFLDALEAKVGRATQLERCQEDLPLALALQQAVPMLERAIRWDRIRSHRRRKRREEEGLS